MCLRSEALTLIHPAGSDFQVRWIAVPLAAALKRQKLP